jgi:soluble lytic murein transglycosylase-like protein
MIGRLAATTVALALCASAAEAAPQALRGSIATEAAAPGEATVGEAVAPARRTPSRRSTRRAAAAERVLVVPADAVLAAPSGPVAKQIVPPRRPQQRLAARPTAVAAVPVEAAAVPADQVVAVPEAPAPVLRGRRRASRVVVDGPAPAATSRRSDLEARIAAHAQATGVPADLIHHVITRESRYNPGAVGRGGVYGLMQIKHGTARALGYAGSPSGLLDPETNLTYGVRYLAGAYKVANGNSTRAYSLFRSGYYYHAKRRGLRTHEYASVPEPTQTASVAAPATVGDALARLFAGPTQAPQRDPAR